MAASQYDVIIAGLGAMGSATLYHLARRGARVLGLDLHDPPHSYGSSHGESRIIREAYFEDPVYVPLVRRAFELWRALEDEVDGSLLEETGALLVGDGEGEVIRGSLRSAREHGIPHEKLDADEIARRFPMFRPEPRMVGVYETRGGVLDPEGCVAAHLVAAESRGAEIRSFEGISRWQGGPKGVEVGTANGTYRGEHLVLAAGSWLPELVPELPLTVERQVMLWFEPRFTPEALRPGQCPVFLFEVPGGRFYGVPDLGGGVKAARHHGGVTAPLEQIDAHVHAADVADVRGFLERYVPAAAGRFVRGSVCRYTNTPTTRFLLDRHPGETSVWLLSACSGHGFKFSSVVGEIMAGKILDGEAAYDVERFTLASHRQGGS
jgi:sarcosine oxidase